MNWTRSWRSYWQGIFAILIIAIFIGVAVAAPLFAPPDSAVIRPAFRQAQNPLSPLPNPPNTDYHLGTVPLGANRHLDIFYTLIWGTRTALLYGLGITLVASIFGSLVGALCSYLGGVPEQVILRITDGFLTFPVIAGVVVFGQIIFPVTRFAEPGDLQSTLLQLGIDNVVIALVCFGWMPYTRLIHADMERTRQAEFVVAARAAGARPGRIIFRHLIPNSISNVIVLATKDIGGMVLIQATFTFIGVGGNSDWGQELAIGGKWIIGLGGNPLEYWWVFLPVTGALILFGIGWNLFGDFLNERLNPRLRYEVMD